MTNHFNQLTEGEQERLAILIEECSEVIHIGCKILRHGYASDNNGKLPETNRRMLERELGDLMHALDRMCITGDIGSGRIWERVNSKPQHILPYLHHQGAKPTTDAQLDAAMRLAQHPVIREEGTP